MVSNAIFLFISQIPDSWGIPFIGILYNSQSTNWLDVVYKVAMIIIGVVNASFAFYIFYYRNRVEKKKELENLRRDILNSFVLKYKLQTFYDYFTELVTNSEKLLDRQASLDDVKIILDDKNQDVFSSVRKNFTEYLDAVDASLYKKILKICDDLQGEISENLFDENVDLRDKCVYKEYILSPIQTSQKEILVALFSYK
ncbi:hypothetical protein [Segatella copri]|uniref:hypothetical protein n=1 Tax=Segatella copri TaxID=165179 RepID=UPI0025DE6727|nr:hypothetical protein [Segatella copri]